MGEGGLSLTGSANFMVNAAKQPALSAQVRAARNLWGVVLYHRRKARWNVLESV